MPSGAAISPRRLPVLRLTTGTAGPQGNASATGPHGVHAALSMSSAAARGMNAVTAKSSVGTLATGGGVSNGSDSTSVTITNQSVGSPPPLLGLVKRKVGAVRGYAVSRSEQSVPEDTSVTPAARTGHFVRPALLARPTVAHGDFFRSDIEGLRAVAVGLVCVYHTGLGALPGGYVGVDIFFVVSGFLVTGVLVRELEAKGTVALGAFYARRIRRLVPAAATMMICLAVLGAALFTPVQRRELTVDLIASALYGANWKQIREATAYSAQGSEQSPLLHMWSLAVEGQFYFLWPVILLAVTLLGRRDLPSLRRRLTAVMAGCVASSYAFALWLATESGNAAYLSTATRCWELAAGGLLALVQPGRITWSKRHRSVLSWAAVVLIAVAAATLTDATPFPAPWGVMPVAGALLLIAAGDHHHVVNSSAVCVNRVLKSAPMRYVGRVSYPWYLWHWPVLVMARELRPDLPLWGGLLAVTASFVPAALTHHLVERPTLRKRHVAGGSHALVLGTACTAATLAAAALAWSNGSGVKLAELDDAKGAVALGHGPQIQQAADRLRPLPESAGLDLGSKEATACVLEQRGFLRSGECAFGDLSSRTTVVLFGDSHAHQYEPALSTIARKRGWRLLVLTKSGCSPADVRLFSAPLRREYRECAVWRANALERIRNEQPAMVITGNNDDKSVIANGERLGRRASAQALQEGYAHVLRRLKAMGTQVIVLGDNPHPTGNVPSCVSGAVGRLPDCAFPKRRGLPYELVSSRAARSVEGVTHIDPAAMLCGKGICPAVIGNVIVYRNGAHITATYMRTLTNWLDTQLPHTTR